MSQRSMVRLSLGLRPVIDRSRGAAPLYAVGVFRAMRYPASVCRPVSGWPSGGGLQPLLL